MTIKIRNHEVQDLKSLFPTLQQNLSWTKRKNFRLPCDFTHVTVDLELGLEIVVRLEKLRVFLQVVEHDGSAGDLETRQAVVDESNPYALVFDGNLIAVQQKLLEIWLPL